MPSFASPQPITAPEEDKATIVELRDKLATVEASRARAMEEVEQRKREMCQKMEELRMYTGKDRKETATVAEVMFALHS